MSSLEKRLIVNCWGGLGNQLFEYAAGLSFAKATGRSLEIVKPLAKNESWNGHARPYQLELFSITHATRNPDLLDRIFLSTNPKVTHTAALLGAVLHARTINEEITYRFSPDLLQQFTQKSIFLNGFWQSAGYVSAVESILRQEYRIKAQATGRNVEYAQQIAALACPVSLHLRLGDYSQILHTSPTGEVVSLVLRKEYYRAAIAAIRERFAGYTLIVFSDDQPAARAFLAEEQNCLFIEGNDAATAHEDLRLMSLCRHHIIANSSFSWWGAWLNSRTDKQVFAPKFWGNTSESFYPDLYPTGWHILDNLS